MKHVDVLGPTAFSRQRRTQVLQMLIRFAALPFSYFFSFVRSFALAFFNFPGMEKGSNQGGNAGGNSGDGKNSGAGNNQGNNNQGNNQNNQGQGQNQRNPNRNLLLIMVVLGVVFALSFFYSNINAGSRNAIEYSRFLERLERNEISAVTILEQREIQGVFSDGTRFRTLIPYFDDTLMPKLREKGILFTGAKPPVTFLQIISSALPWAVSIIFIMYMLRSLRGFGGGGLPFLKSKVRTYVNNGDKKVMFSDVAGQEEAKYELQEVVEFLKQPEKFEKIGARIPRGVLLVGSPGTGKTLLARACAGEAAVSFFYMSGSDFVEMFAGVGASRVRELFDQARKSAPCIVFIDELDAVGRSRSSGQGFGVHDEREQTLNQLLVEMDGFDMRDRIIVLAATNRADVLDKALLRPGRFDRQVVVDMPDMHEREQILKIHSKNVKMDSKVNLTQIARATVGCSGADLANLVNEAALYAARRGRSKVSMDDFEEARDKILMGAARKSKVITAEDKLRTARHESGHALLHLLLENADPLHKVTIIPRGRALGVAFSLPENDSYGKGRAYLMDRISICYGGYVAENMYYKENSTGVQNDLEQATNIASAMVREWGMSKLGPVSFSKKSTSVFMPYDEFSNNAYSDETSREIDSEIKNILDACLKRAEELLSRHKHDLETLTVELMKHETLLGEQVEKLIKEGAHPEGSGEAQETVSEA